MFDSVVFLETIVTLAHDNLINIIIITLANKVYKIKLSTTFKLWVLAQILNVVFSYFRRLYFLFYNDEIGEIFTKKANKLSFNGGDCGYAEKTLTQYKNIYKTFQNRPGSIDIKGDYLVALFSDNNSGGPYCQTFNQDVPNLNMQTFIAAGHSIGDVYIIPIN